MNHVVLLLALLAISIIGISEAEASGKSGISVVNCDNNSNPILTISTEITSELSYDLTLEINQVFGECEMKNKLGRTYVVPWTPISYDIELLDMDFKQVISKKQSVAVLDNKFSLDYNLFADIPYCIKVTSTWLDAHFPVITSSSKCFSMIGQI